MQGGSRMNLSHLRYFDKLAELKSYTNAAKELYITQPALSAAIKSLESEIGFSLIKKTGRHVDLTPEGTRFQQRAHAALKEIDEGIAEGRAGASQEPRPVRLGVSSHDQIRYLAAIIRALRNENETSARFEVVQGTAPHVLHLAARQQVELAFVDEADPSQPLAYERAIPYRAVAYLAESSPLAALPRLSVQDLRDASLITCHDDTRTGARIRLLMASAPLRAIAEFEDEETLCSMVRANPDQVALVAVPAGCPEAHPGLAAVPVDLPGQPLCTFAAHRADAPLSTAAASLLRRLTSQAAKEDAYGRT